jgi:NADPH-dependent curcumin reductase CurA
MVGKIILVLAIPLLGTCSTARVLAACDPETDGRERPEFEVAKAAFLAHIEYRIAEYKVASEVCADEIDFFFEAVGSQANVGNHWLVRYDKKTKSIELSDGM